MKLGNKNSPISTLERISALHRNVMRQFVQKNDLQMVHLEILLYLSNCNKHSDTAQALTYYLGQTKGSISQSLSLLEEEKYIRREQNMNDKRIFHLRVEKKGKNLVSKFNNYFEFPVLSEKVNHSLLKLLIELQKKYIGRK